MEEDDDGHEDLDAAPATRESPPAPSEDVQPVARPDLVIVPGPPEPVSVRFRLTPALDDLNEHAKELDPNRRDLMSGRRRSGPGRRLFMDIKRRLERWVDRVLPGELSLSEMAIVRAVQTRTLPWGHYAAQITNNQMLYGMREHYQPGGHGPYILDEHLLPVWTGTGLDPRTFRNARASCLAKGLMVTFDIPRVGRRPTQAYMLSTPQVLLDMARQELDPNAEGRNDTVYDFHRLLLAVGARWPRNPTGLLNPATFYLEADQIAESWRRRDAEGG